MINCYALPEKILPDNLIILCSSKVVFNKFTSFQKKKEKNERLLTIGKGQFKNWTVRLILLHILDKKSPIIKSHAVKS